MKKRILALACTTLSFTFSIGFAHAAPSVTAKENLKNLIATKSCPGCDLSGLNFNRMDLSKSNLEGADLSMSSFFLTNLSYANLKNTTLNGAVFGGAAVAAWDSGEVVELTSCVRRVALPIMWTTERVRKVPLEYDVLVELVRKINLDYQITSTELVRKIALDYEITDQVELVRKINLNYLPPSDSRDIALSYDVTVAGVQLSTTSSISFVNTRRTFKHSATLIMKSDDYELCEIGESVVLTLAAEIIPLVVVDRNRARSGDDWVYTVFLESPVCFLNSPFADQLDGDHTGTAADLANGFATGHTLNWDTVNWSIGEDLLSGSGRTPREMLTLLAETAGGILRSEFDGTVTVEPSYPVSVNLWDSTTPLYVINTLVELDSDSMSGALQRVYNAVYVGETEDADSSETVISLASETNDDGSVLVQIYMMPWDDDLVFDHTGDSTINMMSVGDVTRSVTETVEIVGGEGNCDYPVVSVASYNYNADDLGALTVDDDGGVTTAGTDESLIEVTYYTKSRNFIISSLIDQEVQVVAETPDDSGNASTILVSRSPADSFGDGIYDQLLTNDAVRRERGRNYIDGACSQRKMVVHNCQFETLYRMGELVAVTDPVDISWVGMLVEQQVDIAISGESFTATTSIIIEREVV